MKSPFVRSAYNYDADLASLESGLSCPKGSGLTLQSQAQDADINVMLKRFAVTGQLPQSGRVPTYQQFSEVFDYRSAMDTIVQADRAFMSLPAEVRARFANDVASFLEFCSREENLPELRRLGLAEAEKPAARVAPVDQLPVDTGSDSSKSDKKRAKSRERDE